MIWQTASPELILLENKRKMSEAPAHAQACLALAETNAVVLGCSGREGGPSTTQQGEPATTQHINHH